MSIINTLIVVAIISLVLTTAHVYDSWFPRSHMDFECSSNFQRNSHQDHSLYFTGSFDISLNNNGAGNFVLIVNGVYGNPFTVFRSYDIDYYFDENARMHSVLKKITIHESDNVSLGFLKKYIFDLAFDSDGQFRVYRGDNSLLFFSNKMLVTTCWKK